MAWAKQYIPGGMARDPADSVQGGSRLDRFGSGAKMLLQTQLRSGINNSTSGRNTFVHRSLQSQSLNLKLKQYADSSANKVGPDGKVKDWDKGDFNQYWHTQLRGLGKLFQKHGDSLFQNSLKITPLSAFNPTPNLRAASALGVKKSGT